MRILFWNLGYARGHAGAFRDYMKSASRFVTLPIEVQQSVLNDVVAVLEEADPDIFACAEISTGGTHNQSFDQFAYLQSALRTRPLTTCAVSKYKRSLYRRLPFHVGNANGVMSFVPGTISTWHLAQSRKTLVMQVDCPGLIVLVVHLPLIGRDRRRQLGQLATVVNECAGDVIVCGDFNTFNGIDELAFLTERTGLEVAGEGVSTYPSSSPRWQLDIFLYRLQGKTVPNVRTLSSKASDHRPVVLEW